MQGVARAFPAFLLSRFMSPKPGGWLPGVWSEVQCKPEELSEEFWQATKPHRNDFERLGFTACGFSKARGTLDPMVRDSGVVVYLDPTRRHVGHLIYNRIHSQKSGREINRIIISFMAAFEDFALACTNGKGGFDPATTRKVFRLDSYDVVAIHQEFLRQLQPCQGVPREFKEFESLKDWLDSRQIADFEDHVRRKLFILMSDSEVESAKQRLVHGQAAAPGARRRLSPTAVVWIALCGLILVLQHYKGHSHANRGTIVYRGQEFKTRKAFASYEDYKDDPDNLEASELGRIEQAMISAKVPTSFSSRAELDHFLIHDMKFPGYGLSVGQRGVTDDGSLVELESVEIPQRDKDRIIVVRQSEGSLHLVDDFVFETATNGVKQVQLTNQILRYYDNSGRLVREKRI